MSTPTKDAPRDPYRELFERSPDAILIIDGETFVDCNQATVNMLRYASREDVLETHPSELSPELQPDGRSSYEKANEMIMLAFERGCHRFEWDHKRADGEVFPVEVLLTAVPRGDHKILHVVWRDITERKRLERELRQAQKTEAIGQLTGGIAHDFNNLLVSILGHADLIELDIEDRQRLLEHVDEIRDAADRAAALVSQLLAFSRKQVLKPRVVDLNGIVDRLLAMIHRLIGEDILIVRRSAKGHLRIKADPSQIEQVVLNLVTNARDAMPRGGQLALETAEIAVDEHTIGATAGLPPGRYAVLVVTDTGEGIAPDVLPSIFDPFFTTKEPGRGTGLGLSTVHGIVKQSAGDISVFSEVDHGASFKVFLPLTLERPQPIPSSLPPRPAGGNTETILVVEDESAVADLVSEVLQHEGYTVHIAENGEAALERIEKEDLAFDLLLTDVVMPHMSGPDLCSRLWEDRPALRVLYASGYTDDALTVRGVLEQDVDLIQKPFTPRVLVDRVRAALDRDVDGQPTEAPDEGGVTT